MMMKPAPASTFKVSQTQLLLQLLIVALDDPAMFRHLDQRLELGLRRQCRDPILAGFSFPPRPLDQQPFFPMRLRFFVVPARGAHSHSGKTRSQFLLRPFAPSNILPGRRRQSCPQFPSRHGLMSTPPAPHLPCPP